MRLKDELAKKNLTINDVNS